MKFVKFLFYILTILLVLFIKSKEIDSKLLDKNMDKYYWILNHTKYTHNSSRISNYILDVSNRLLDNNYKLLTCILKTESDFNNFKTGDGGKAYGIGQMHEKAMIDSCKYLGLKSCEYSFLKRKVMKSTLFSIELSAGYLSFLYKHYKGDLDKTIMAYNAGMNNVKDNKFNMLYLKKVKKCINSD